MPLSRDAINELKAIYSSEFGENLSDRDAWEMGHRLLRIFETITRSPSPEKDLRERL